MNRAIFERIEIGEDGEVTDTALTPVYDALSAWQPGLGRPDPAQEGTQAQDGPLAPCVRLSTAPVHRGVTFQPAKGGDFSTGLDTVLPTAERVPSELLSARQGSTRGTVGVATLSRTPSVLFKLRGAVSGFRVTAQAPRVDLKWRPLKDSTRARRVET